MAKITIDGTEHEFEEGMNLFEAVRQANGQPLPHFCYHPGLPIAGVCRMCQVEIEGVPKLVIACNAQVRDGMVVRTDTDKVKETVRTILNFHLLHHPVDCPVCDQAGECALQDFYMDYGLYEPEIDQEEKIAKGKVKPIGDLVMLDAERCVLCARCTRFTSEITKTHELGIFNRGNHAEIDVAPGMTLDNNYSLNTVDICPVGALTSRDFRFKKRVWWLKDTESICDGCATGCNSRLSHDDGVLYRARPRPNPEVNQYWMCDHGRLLYKRVGSQDRLRQPSLREADGPRPISWDGALAEFEELAADRQLVFVGSPHASLEELHALARLARACEGTVLGHRLAGTEMGEADDLLLSADRTPNEEGARRLGLEPFEPAALAAAAGPDRMLVVLMNDLAALSEEAAAALDGFGAVVGLLTHEGPTAARSTLVLPVWTTAEKEGLFVNRQGRAQVFHRAVDAPPHTRDAVEVLAEIGRRRGHEGLPSTVAALRAEIAGTVDGFGALADGVGPEGVPLDSGERTEVQS